MFGNINLPSKIYLKIWVSLLFAGVLACLIHQKRLATTLLHDVVQRRDSALPVETSMNKARNTITISSWNSVVDYFIWLRSERAWRGDLPYIYWKVLPRPRQQSNNSQL